MDLIVEQKVDDLERRVTALEREHAVNDVLRGSIEKRLAGIEDTLKWLVRLVIGGILSAALLFVISGGMV